VQLDLQGLLVLRVLLGLQVMWVPGVREEQLELLV